MDSEYVKEQIGKYVKVELENGYYYKGKIISVGNSSLVMLDKLNRTILLSLRVITEIKEVSGGRWDIKNGKKSGE